MHQLTELHPLTWDEVFAIWRETEAKLPRWIEHYRARGFSSWDEWRGDDVKALEPEKLRWKLYRINNPAQAIPLFRGGAFRSWIKNTYPACQNFHARASDFYHARDLPPFSEIVNVPSVQASDLVKDIMKHPPAATTLIGLKTDDGIVLLEGMHRCCAFALMSAQDQKIPVEISIALADFFAKAIPISGQPTSPAA